MSEELKPCPFCGNKNIVISMDDYGRGFQGVCDRETAEGCGATSRSSRYPEDAKRIWNTRSHDR